MHVRKYTSKGVGSRGYPRSKMDVPRGNYQTQTAYQFIPLILFAFTRDHEDPRSINQTA
jgi:hypothetical protein